MTDGDSENSVSSYNDVVVGHSVSRQSTQKTALLREAKRGRLSTPSVRLNSVDALQISREETNEGGSRRRSDLEVYRESRRMSRNSSGMFTSNQVDEEPDTGGKRVNAEDCATTPIPAAVTSASSAEQPNGEEYGKQMEKNRGVSSGPACLVSCTERIEACTESIQAWTDQLEENTRRKQEEKRNAAVMIKDDGTVVEPKGDSWLQRKFMVFVVFIILSWVYVVFVWRICVTGIKIEARLVISRTEGIGLLVGFHIIWLMVIWSYIRVLLAPPGYARDHVAISEPPPPIEQYFHSAPPLSQKDSDASPHIDLSNVPSDRAVEEAREETIDPLLPALFGPMGAGQAAKIDEEKTMQEAGPSQQAYWANHNQQPNAVVGSKIPEPIRMPPQSAPLHPINMYCHRCKRNKPPRSHHCRHCATCVLKMDHHCPWVGGCVGARNHKFFYHFIQWVTLLELFVLIVDAIAFSRGLQRRNTNQGWTIDGYMISLFPICAMFLLFTGALVITHTYLFILNITTIEHMGYNRITTREEILLSRYLDAREDSEGTKLNFRQKSQEKSRIKKNWTNQWGNLKTEANLWWLDDRERALASGKPRTWYHSIRPNLTLALGDNWYQWILPLGRAKSDGLNYDSNWRFAEGGLWRTREEWSKDNKQP